MPAFKHMSTEHWHFSSCLFSEASLQGVESRSQHTVSIDIQKPCLSPQAARKNHCTNNSRLWPQKLPRHLYARKFMQYWTDWCKRKEKEWSKAGIAPSSDFRRLSPTAIQGQGSCWLSAVWQLLLLLAGVKALLLGFLA